MNLDAYEDYLQIKRSVQDKLANCDSAPLAIEAKSQLNLVESRMQDAVDKAINAKREHLISINLMLLAENNKDD